MDFDVIVIGGGGIGHDVSIFLSIGKHRNKSKIEAFNSHWGIGEERNQEKKKFHLLHV